RVVACGSQKVSNHADIGIQDLGIGRSAAIIWQLSRIGLLIGLTDRRSLWRYGGGGWRRGGRHKLRNQGQTRLAGSRISCRATRDLQLLLETTDFLFQAFQSLFQRFQTLLL